MIVLKNLLDLHTVNNKGLKIESCGTPKHKIKVVKG